MAAPPAWSEASGAPVLARLSAAHAEFDNQREALVRTWRRETPAMELQIRTLEETIVLLEREVKSTAALLAKAVEDGSGAADLELVLGAFEDKLMRTSQEVGAALSVGVERPPLRGSARAHHMSTCACTPCPCPCPCTCCTCACPHM
jgi:hypothetical protein